MARRIAVFVAVIAVVGLLLWAGFYNLRARRAAMQKIQQSQVTLTKTDNSSSSEQPDTLSLEGKAAPAFTLRDTTGKKVSLADFKGKPVIVNFWATWCGPCRLEMPWFAEFAKKYQPQGLVILGISEDDGAPTGDIVKAAQKSGVNYPILLHDDSVSKAYGGVDYLPETFYIGGNGVVVEETAGAPSKDEMEADILKTIGAAK